MADIVDKIARGESEAIDLDFIKKHGDDVRKRILDDTQVDISKTAPNVYSYRVPA